jgi:hypothetical protein
LDPSGTISLGIYEIISLILASGLVSVGATLLITYLQTRQKEREQRRQTAAILGNEIASIKLLSNQAVKVHEEELRIFQEQSAKGTIMHMTLKDVDFSRAIYDRPSIDLALFTPDLAATIAELYRWTGFAHQVKDGVNHTSKMLSEAAANWAISRSAFFPTKDPQVSLASQNFVSTLQGYINDHQRIAEMSQEALDGLNKIVKIDETKVKGDYFPTLEPKPTSS